MNKRQTAILESLKNSKRYIHYGELSAIYGVSERSIRYDIDVIEAYLKDKNINIIRDRRMGIKLDIIRGSKKDEYSNGLAEPEEKQYFISEERFNTIVQILLFAVEPITKSSLMKQLLIGKTTLRRDIERCREYLCKWGGVLIDRHDGELALQYDEMAWRRVAVKYLRKQLNDTGFYSLIYPVQIDDFTLLESCVGDYTKEFVNSRTLLASRKFIRKFEIERMVKLTDDSFIETLLYISVSVERINRGNVLNEMIPRLSEEIAIEDKEWINTNGFILENRKLVTLDAEKEWILAWLLGAKKNSDYCVINQPFGKNASYYMAKQFVEDISGILSIDMRDNDMLHRFLATELASLKYRAISKNQTLSSHTSDIMKDYPVLFRACRIAIQPIESFYNEEISNDEVASLCKYIVVEIGDQIKKEEGFSRINVVVVCAGGVGTGSFIKMRLMKAFPEINIKSVCNVSEILGGGVLDDTDLVITTEPFISLFDGTYRVLTVSPIITNEDLKEIRKRLSIISTDKKDSGSELIDDLMNIIYEHCYIKDAENLILDIKNYFHKTKKDKKDIMLKELINEETMELHVDVADWEDAIRQAGSILVTNGCVKPEYVDAMIETKRKMGPYIVLTNGFAMPHARPSEGVEKLGMSLITLKEPIVFGSEDFDPVKVVLALAAADNTSHLSAMQELAELLDDDEVVNKFWKADSKEEILNLINAQ